MRVDTRDPQLLHCLTVLELGPDCSAAELTAAYRRLCKRYHPDRRPVDEAAVANELLAEINAAYQYLKRRLAGA